MGVPLDISLGVAYTESRFNPRAHNLNTNGTVDHGIFQVNDAVFKDLKTVHKPCVYRDILIGVYWLKCLYKRAGSWDDAIRAFNAGFAGMKRGGGFQYLKLVWAYAYSQPSYGGEVK